MAKALPRNLKPLDLMLMREMALDATQTTTDLAKKLGRSRSTVQWRLQELLDKKVIKIIPVHNPVAAGYKMGVLIGLKVLPNRVGAIAAEMATASALWLEGIPPVRQRKVTMTSLKERALALKTLMTALITSGPVTNMCEVLSIMKMKSVMPGE